ncbi:Uncharacterised protein [Ewingella americana]|uniref:Uncharacterized protein n=1 Tax=Ewingella americana TaxID=41202 RepID=A0A377THN8_9GAMM|nr:Uncharacterised protein [Ewingella americana]
MGRIMLDEIEDTSSRDLGDKGGLFEHGLPNKIVNDYSADATMRSIEDSLKRLKTDRLDIVWITIQPKTSTVIAGLNSSTLLAPGRSVL